MVLKLILLFFEDLVECMIVEVWVMVGIVYFNVVEVFDVGIIDCEFYIVMWLVEGDILWVWVSEVCSVDEWFDVLFVVGEGLVVVYVVGFIYYDFKFDNVFVVIDG